MTTDHDPRTRIVLSWLREDAYENPEHMLLRALDEVDATPQRRSWWPARRSNRMNTYAKLIVAAAAVLLVAVVGYQFLPSSGGVGGEPTIAPSPSPSLLARGSFTAHGIAAELDATGSGADVAGTMSLSESGTSNRATVDLECARTTADGLIEIGGLLTDSTFPANNELWHGGFPEGQRVAIIFEPGSPVKAIWWEEAVASCAAIFESIDNSVDEVSPGSPGLDPIQGTVELGGSGSDGANAPSSPTPTLLARGNFTAKGAPVELDATGDGDNVTGTMTVGDAADTLFAVDLTCARTAEDGRILIGGDTTESNGDWVQKGDYTAIVLKPGSPVHAVYAFGSDAASADTCMEFLEGIIDQHFATAIGDGALEPIEGTVELGP